jgi:hypothetical protein
VPQGERLQQLRARLISVREQRNRMARRSAELERTAAQEVAAARRTLDDARSALPRVKAEVAARQAEVREFESDRRQGPGDIAERSDWRRAWRAAHDGLAEAEELRVGLEARAAEAQDRLRTALSRQEGATAEQARAVDELANEMDELMQEISRLQASAPRPDEPDPRFRDVLLDRLHHLEAERAWLAEEIRVREERLGRIGMEVSHVRSLLELHTPDWGKEALEVLAPSTTPERTVPAWRQAVVDVLAQTDAPAHYRDISLAIAKAGHGLGGQDPAETLLAALSRDPEFERVGRGLYWLAARPLPASWPGRRTARS